MKYPTITKQVSQPPGGFTLIELLITVSIILVLAALAFSGFVKMRNSAYKVVTFRNVSQLQIANASYAADHNGKYVPRENVADDGTAVPGERYWFQNTDFLRNLRGEPKNDNDNDAPIGLLDPLAVKANKKNLYVSIYGSFGYNMTAMPTIKTPSGKGYRAGFNTQQVVNPSRTMVFITACDWNANWGSQYMWEKDPVDKISTNHKIAYRYHDKAICVYYDAHVGEMSLADMHKLDSDANKAGLNPADAPYWRASDPNTSH